MIDVRKPVQLSWIRECTSAVAVVAVALLGVLLLGRLNGLLLSTGQSLLGLVYRSVQAYVDEMGKVPGEKAAWGSCANHPERTPPKGCSYCGSTDRSSGRMRSPSTIG